MAKIFSSPEFLEIKAESKKLAKNLKEEYTWYKRHDAKSPLDMEPSPAKTRRLILEQINYIRHLKKTLEENQEYLNLLIKQHEEQNYGH